MDVDAVINECDDCRVFYKRMDKEEKQPLLSSCAQQVGRNPMAMLFCPLRSSHASQRFPALPAYQI